MTSLRKRLWLGFGGVLLILVVVCILSVEVLTRYSTALEATLRENFSSITYCDQMKSTLHTMDEAVAATAWNQREPISAAEFDPQAVIDAALSSKYGAYTEAHLAA